MSTTQTKDSGTDVSTTSLTSDVCFPLQTDSIKDQEIYDKDKNINTTTFVIPVYRNFKICICKPLIPLKLALLFIYGSVTPVSAFLVLSLKHRGITLSEISIIYAISPMVQTIGPIISGIIADKIGRSKPVLVANVLLMLLSLIGISVAPSIHMGECVVNLKCHQNKIDWLVSDKNCDETKAEFHLHSCILHCPNNMTLDKHREELMCEMSKEIDVENTKDFSVSVRVNYSMEIDSLCNYRVTSVSYINTTCSLCNISHALFCNILCINSEEQCENNERYPILFLYMALVVLNSTVVTTCFRFMDLTAMMLTNKYNSDFGKQRFFSVIGIIIFNLIAGKLIDITTASGHIKNFNIVFYFSIVTIGMLLASIYKLDVQINLPGRNMFMKSVYLLKNPDTVVLILTLVVLGAAWSFNKFYLLLYLEKMNSNGTLLGLVYVVSSLYCLPFLATSKWWVKKIGCSKMITLALLGYAANEFGYSFIYDPWLSLLLETTNVFCYHLLWVAVTVHCYSLAPEGLTATVLSTAGVLHYSVGRSVGSLLGGQIMATFGGRMAFCVLASICFATAIFYQIYLYIRKFCWKRDSSQHAKNTSLNSI